MFDLSKEATDLHVIMADYEVSVGVVGRDIAGRRVL